MHYARIEYASVAARSTSRSIRLSSVLMSKCLFRRACHELTQQGRDLRARLGGAGHAATTTVDAECDVERRLSPFVPRIEARPARGQKPDERRTAPRRRDMQCRLPFVTRRVDIRPVLERQSDALGGIQKYGESGSFGRVGSAPNRADATEARVEMLAVIALRSRFCASCHASKEPSEIQPIGRRSRRPPPA